jgi:hypothetical protein
MTAELLDTIRQIPRIKLAPEPVARCPGHNAGLRPMLDENHNPTGWLTCHFGCVVDPNQKQAGRF